MGLYVFCIGSALAALVAGIVLALTAAAGGFARNPNAPNWNSSSQTFPPPDLPRISGAPTFLHQSDFARGTFRIFQSGRYVLAEDIIFEPNPDANWRPLPNDQTYNDLAYRLGFFAAITIETPDVEIDLNGKWFNASAVFSIQQRFYSHIELTAQPFISGEGPADFGNRVSGTERVYIHNGRFGRSPHHAIHGNGMQHVTIRDLLIADYEVASIALNGIRDALIENVRAVGAFRQVPVAATFSQARILGLFAQKVNHPEVTAAMANLQPLVDQVVSDVRATGKIDEVAHPLAAALFKNVEGVIDGNTYGMLIHPRGNAVNALWHAEPPQDDAATHRVCFRNVEILLTESFPIEVIALAHTAGVNPDDPSNTNQRGPAGDNLRFFDNVGRLAILDNATGAFVSNPIVEVQLAMARANLPATTRGLTLNIDPRVLEWTRGERTLASLIESGDFHWRRNGDSMFHVNKGVFGLRIDGANQVVLDHVTIDGVRNQGLPGTFQPLPGETSGMYTNDEDGGHPAQGRQRGYMGADVRGLSIAASTNVQVTHVHVRNVHSKWGLAFGFDFFNRAGILHVGPGCTVSNVSTLTDWGIMTQPTWTMGTKAGVAVGVRISGGSQLYVFGDQDIAVSNVSSHAIDGAYDRLIDSECETYVPQNPFELANTFTL